MELSSPPPSLVQLRIAVWTGDTRDLRHFEHPATRSSVQHDTRRHTATSVSSQDGGR